MQFFFCGRVLLFPIVFSKFSFFNGFTSQIPIPLIAKTHCKYGKFFFFLTTIWLPHIQLWAIIEEAASLT